MSARHCKRLVRRSSNGEGGSEAIYLATARLRRGFSASRLRLASSALLSDRFCGRQRREEGRSKHPVEHQPGPDRIALVAVIQRSIEKAGRRVIQVGLFEDRDRAACEQLRIVALGDDRLSVEDLSRNLRRRLFVRVV